MPSRSDVLFDRLGEPAVRELSAAATVRLLARLARLTAGDTASLLRFHDRLLFLCAHPPSRLVRRRCEALLRQTAARVRRLEEDGADMDAFDAPEVAGVAGTTITTDFSFELARWLRARHGKRIRIDWGACDATDRMRATWPRFLPLLEEEALADANVPYLDWLGAAAGTRARDAGWLLDRYARLPYPEAETAERWDALGAPVEWDLGDSRASRTRMRLPARSLFLHRRPLLSRRDVSLDAVFAEPPLPVRRLSRREGEKICDLVRETTASRYREFYTFTFADPSSVLAASPGRGVELFLLGVRPERRLPLRAAYGGFVVKNGVPVGYIEGLAFFERLEIGFNLYYAFREGESAWIYAQVLKFHHDALGVSSFSVDPYQLGFENAEAIASGAFWFYRKLGFRPTGPAVARRVEREEARIRADPAYRSSPATLRALVTHNVLYETPGTASKDWDRFHVRRLGLSVNRKMARDFGGDPERIHAAAQRRVAAQTGLRPERLSPGERAAFEEFALVVDLIPDLSRWSRMERESLARIIRAKAGRSERGYLRLLQGHRRLREALIRLGSRA